MDKDIPPSNLTQENEISGIIKKIGDTPGKVLASIKEKPKKKMLKKGLTTTK